jgi:hypothetical protein
LTEKYFLKGVRADVATVMDAIVDAKRVALVRQQRAQKK